MSSPLSLPAGFFRQIVDDVTIEVALHWNTEAWNAAMEWLVLHEVDPEMIPEGTTIEVDRNLRQIRYLRCRLDANGQYLVDHARQRLVTDPAVQQGEALAPFPDVLEREFSNGLRWLRG